MKVERFTPASVMKPLGPYSHMTKAGPFLTIGGVAGIDPATNRLAGPDVFTQASQILEAFGVMLEEVGCNMSQVLHVNVFLKNVEDYEEMNRAFREAFGDRLPARTVVCVKDLPKEGALLTMNLSAVIEEVTS
jgi:2-iminobutanoate/2-iminopropanoate deaminase